MSRLLVARTVSPTHTHHTKVTVEKFGAWAQMYMILERPSNTSQLTYTFNWHGTRQQPTTMFSWDGQCCQAAVHPYIDFSNVAIYADW
jgi:hypothetical protein